MNCPHCQRVLYSRKRKTCGFCGKELPPECLFSEMEMAKINAEQQAIEQRRKDDKAKEEKNRKGKASHPNVFMPPMGH